MTSTPLRVLHLEDSAVDAELVRYHLEALAQAVGEPAPTITVSETRAGFEAALEQGGWDLVLADYRLPAYDGLTALRAVRARYPEVPFIFVTGELGEERAIETLQQGATDYVLKTRLGRLGPSVERARRAAQDRAERLHAQAAAAAERERLRVTLGSIGDAVIATDIRGRITFLNQIAEALTGWSQAEAVGQPITSVFHIIDEETGAEQESPVARVLREDAIVGLANPTLLLPRSGAAIPIDDSGAPIRDADGHLLGVVLVFRDVRERRAAELALSRSEERYRSLVEAHNAIVWMADPRGQFITRQPSWEKYTGQPFELHQGFGWLEMIHPEDRPQLLAGWEAAVASGQPFNGIARVWHAPGHEWCHSEVRAIPLVNPDGQVREWVGTITDVHARVNAEGAARESEGRFRILANHAPVMVWMADVNGECDFFNEQWLAFTGRSLDQELGRGWLAGVHPDDLERVMRLDRAATVKRQSNEMEYRLRRHDGEYRWVVDIGVPRYAPDGGFAGYIGSALDIHARREAEAARRESEGRFRILADTAPVMVWMADPTGLADFFNATWLAFTGRPLDAELGDGWTSGISPHDFERTVSTYRAASAARQPFEVEFQLRRHDGQYRWVVTNAVPRYEPDGRFAGYVASGIDIHERKEATQALRATRDQIAAILRGVAEGVAVQAAVEAPRTATDSTAPVDGSAGADGLPRRAALELDNAALYAAAQQQAAWLEARVQERTETLRLSERRLAEAQQIASLGSWHWDIPTNTVSWSEALYRIYGVDPATFAANYEAFTELVHPDDRAYVHDTVQQALAEKRGYSYQHRIIRPDGEVRTLAARGEITLDANGQPSALTGIARDVTDQLRIETELRDSREQLRQLSGHLQAAREAERARISREIHDELGGALTGLKMDVTRLAKNIETLTPDGVRAQTQDILALLDEAVKTVRRIATDLRPALLDDFGLAAAMEWQLAEFEKRSGIACTFTTNTDPDTLALPPASVTALFRVFQETLTNVARHAQATSVSARLDEVSGCLELEVHDNGRGISAEELTGRRSLGLLGMRERVGLLAGELRFDGAPGQGTRVTVRIPLAGSPANAVVEARD